MKDLQKLSLKRKNKEKLKKENEIFEALYTKYKSDVISIKIPEQLGEELNNIVELYALNISQIVQVILDYNFDIFRQEDIIEEIESKINELSNSTRINIFLTKNYLTKLEQLSDYLNKDINQTVILLIASITSVIDEK